jgi:hypothetical protein
VEDFAHVGLPTEAAALLLVAETLGDRDGWGDLARSRLDRLMVDAVDPDGVEVENSPFYHFYVMRFAADIAAWASMNDIELSQGFTERLGDMAEYAAWIVMPDGRIPLLGSSPARTVDEENARELATVAADHPRLEFVLSRGARGEAPETNSMLFPQSGTAILRSGFGSAATYADQTHVVFDVGPYRTAHSHLDGLSVNVHAAGMTVLPDSGLFTYEKGPDYDYFHGTAAHNTVLVDGGDQRAGPVEASPPQSGSGWTYQSGRHTLYDAVDHRRAVVLLDEEHLVVIDLLDGSDEHEFAQLWHFAPEVDVRTAEHGVVGSHKIRFRRRNEPRIINGWNAIVIVGKCHTISSSL